MNNMRNKILSLLVLLMTVASGAWADVPTFDKTEFTADQEYNYTITVTQDMAITISEGKTVTINKGLVIESGATLTVYGPGTLMVYGTDGGDGQSGGTAISGNISIKGGANVQANGGRGGAGSTGQTGSRGGEGGKGGNGGQGGNGGNGGAAFTGAVTIYSGSINAFAGRGGNGGRGGEGGEGGYGPGEPDYTGPGGNGGDGGAGGNGGSGGAAFAGTLTFFGGSVTAVGGSAGDGGTGGDGGEGGEGKWNGSPGNGSMNEGEPGSNGNAFASAPTIQATTYTMTNGDHVDITTATGIKSVILSAADAYDTNDPNDMPPVDVTTNAEAGATFTEASFAMPDFDATVNYDIVRDLATSTKVDLIIGTGSDAVTATADTRLRIAKSNNVYVPVSALSCNFVDQIENNTILPTGFNDAKLTPQFYLQGEDNTWTLVTNINTTTHLPNNLQPGQVYRITLKAADGSYYDGETQPSYTVTLFEGYEVAVPAGEYVTYFRDEPLYADPVSSADAKLYTISSVSTTDGTATLSDAIATAPSNTPLLVYNNSDQAKTFLLIPADAEPNLALTVAPEFIGTLTGTTIAASDANTTNYAFNGKQFVWVKNALDIAANKAWLEVPTGTQSAPILTLVFGDATKIENTNVPNLTNGDWYDLNGRKLQGKPTKKGVYIMNGRKVVVK